MFTLREGKQSLFSGLKRRTSQEQGRMIKLLLYKEVTIFSD